MDEKFLEFWGNFLLNASRGKKQMDDISSWMKEGMEEMAGIFKKAGDIYQFSDQSEEYKKMSEKLSEDFQKSFKDYLGMMGVVSREEHITLVEKYEKLKEKCAEQEETIRHMKMILNAKQQDQTEFVLDMTDIAKKQSEYFKKMMNEFGQFVNTSTPETETREKKAKKSPPKKEGKTDSPAGKKS